MPTLTITGQRLRLWAGLVLTGLLVPVGKAGETAWTALFDGRTLEGWRVTEFGGSADEVHVHDGALILEQGAADLVGVTCTKPVPTLNYDMTLEAKRIRGNDMFCCLTFPLRQANGSLVVGGWGGTLVGISSFDSLDASQNETTTFMEFRTDTWYRIRLRVTADRIQAWIDDEQVVDARPGDREISVRWEVEASCPLGLAAWKTKAAMRNIRMRTLSRGEIREAETE